MITNSRQYNSLHKTINRYWTKTGICEICLNTKKTDWADKNGKYCYDRNEWLELCRSCHAIYDNFQKLEAKLQKSSGQV